MVVAQKEKVFVGLSGGVDSSVAAALLKDEGYDVTGVFIKGWHPEFLPCTWKEDRADAMRAAATLGIPFKTLDLSDAYYKHVVEYLIREYKAGRTPNPDVMCNRHIKFGAFFSWAREAGADFVATGHYARIENNEDGNPRLLTALDTEKDQSYFLWTLTLEDLSHILFPIGEYTKPQVRELARTYGLPTAQKPDSQGVCFLGKLDMKEFLARYIEPAKGDVLDQEGNTIGSHDGAAFYTIGQRHGFTVDATSTSTQPHYVVEKDVERNTLTVATSPAEAVSPVSRVRLESENWIDNEALKRDVELLGRFRYRQRLSPMRLYIDEQGSTAVEMAEGGTGLAKGQSLVLYRQSKGRDALECIGGGVLA